MERPDVFILGVEPSGDKLGADLAKSLRSKEPNVGIAAIGGSALAKTGLPSQMNIDGLAILGFVEGLKALPFVRRKVREAVEIILTQNPRSVVLIDSWGFMVRVAQRLKATGYDGHIVKYVAPQVWATRSGRAKILARHVDHLLSTQPMDAPFFDAAGLPQTYVGNAVLDQDYRCGNAERFRQTHGLSSDRPTAGFFFGSRPAEIERIGPAVAQAQRTIAKAIPALQSVYVVTESIADQVEPLINRENTVVVAQDQLIEAMSVMDGAVAVSGTITTQLAAAGVPTVVLYALSPLTYMAVKRLFKPRFISLVNISRDQHEPGHDEPLMPEFVQDEIFSDEPAQALIDILRDPQRAQRLSQALMDETRRMGAGSEQASDKAADAILSLIA